MARYLIITSRWNELITNALKSGAYDTFKEAGLTPGDWDDITVPGCFELPVVAAQAAKSQKYSGIICLGAVIRGETPHFDFVAGETAAGLMKISVETGVPVSFGVLTTDNGDQALARCGIKSGNKGREAASTALEMSKVMSRLMERPGEHS